MCLLLQRNEHLLTSEMPNQNFFIKVSFCHDFFDCCAAVHSSFKDFSSRRVVYSNEVTLRKSFVSSPESNAAIGFFSDKQHHCS
jgi:hypothetical protein